MNTCCGFVYVCVPWRHGCEKAGRPTAGRVCETSQLKKVQCKTLAMVKIGWANRYGENAASVIYRLSVFLRSKKKAADGRQWERDHSYANGVLSICLPGVNYSDSSSEEGP